MQTLLVIGQKLPMDYSMMYIVSIAAVLVEGSHDCSESVYHSLSLLYRQTAAYHQWPAEHCQALRLINTTEILPVYSIDLVVAKYSRALSPAYLLLVLMMILLIRSAEQQARASAASNDRASYWLHVGFGVSGFCDQAYEHKDGSFADRQPTINIFNAEQQECTWFLPCSVSKWCSKVA